MLWAVITVISALVGVGGAETAASLSHEPITISQIRISPCHKVMRDLAADAAIPTDEFTCDESKVVVSTGSFQSPAK